MFHVKSVVTAQQPVKVRIQISLYTSESSFRFDFCDLLSNNLTWTFQTCTFSSAVIRLEARKAKANSCLFQHVLQMSQCFRREEVKRIENCSTQIEKH